jgi:hypothetical protein
MDKPIFERRRLLQMVSLGSLAFPAIALAACSDNPDAYRRERRWWMHDGGGDHGDKAGGRR